MPLESWLNLLLKLVPLLGLQYLSGLAVEHWGIRVNYTRKLNHFAVFFVPMYVDTVLPWDRRDPLTLAITFCVGLLVLAMYTQPVRSRSHFVATCFRAFDRPEDRPYTLLWLSTQVITGFAVLLPFAAWLMRSGHEALIFIPILVNTLGDGLAEPVGVRFGRHSYRVRGMFTDRIYQRTLEGSACVLLAGIAVVAGYAPHFTAVQLTAALLLLPAAMTLAEALSPHTWDTPFLLAAGYLSLAVVLALP